MTATVAAVITAALIGAGVLVVAALITGYQRQNGEAIAELLHRLTQTERALLDLDKRMAPTTAMPATRPPVPRDVPADKPPPAAGDTTGPDLTQPPPTPPRPWVEADLTAIRARTEGRHRHRRPNPEDSDR